MQQEPANAALPGSVILAIAGFTNRELFQMDAVKPQHEISLQITMDRTGLYS